MKNTVLLLTRTEEGFTPNQVVKLDNTNDLSIPETGCWAYDGRQLCYLAKQGEILQRLFLQQTLYTQLRCEQFNFTHSHWTPRRTPNNTTLSSMKQKFNNSSNTWPQMTAAEVKIWQTSLSPSAETATRVAARKDIINQLGTDASGENIEIAGLPNDCQHDALVAIQLDLTTLLHREVPDARLAATLQAVLQGVTNQAPEALQGDAHALRAHFIPSYINRNLCLNLPFKEQSVQISAVYAYYR